MILCQKKKDGKRRSIIQEASRIGFMPIAGGIRYAIKGKGGIKTFDVLKPKKK